MGLQFNLAAKDGKVALVHCVASTSDVNQCIDHISTLEILASDPAGLDSTSLGQHTLNLTLHPVHGGAQMARDHQLLGLHGLLKASLCIQLATPVEGLAVLALSLLAWSKLRQCLTRMASICAASGIQPSPALQVFPSV